MPPKKTWRKRMGIEPTPRAAAARGYGFEDRGSHQAPSASGRESSTSREARRGGRGASAPGALGDALAHSIPVRVAFLALAATIAYGGALTAGVAWDDAHLVAGNPAIRTLASPWRFFTDAWTQSATGGNNLAQYRPLRTLLFALESAIFGGNAWGFHLVSLALHAVAAWLLGRLATALFGGGAWLAATIWLFHPAASESALYLAAQGNELCLIFALVAALAHVRWLTTQRNGWRVAGVLALLGALGSYEVGMLVAMLLLVIEAVWRWRTAAPWRSPVRGHAPYWIVTAVFIAVRATIAAPVPRPPWWEGSWTAAFFAQLRLWVEGWRLTLLPTSQLVRYMPSDAPAWAPAPFALVFHVALAAFVATALLRRRHRIAAACVVWWYVAQALTSNILVTNLGYMFAPRFLFLAMALPMAAFAGWAERRFVPRNLVLATAVALAAAIPLLRHQVSVWQGPLSLNHEIVRSNPNDFGGHYLLGWTYLLCGDEARARQHLEIARTLAPAWPMTHHLLGELHLRAGDLRAAHAEFKTVVDLAPQSLPPRARLAEVALAAGQPDAARAWLATIASFAGQAPYSRARADLTLARIEMALGERGRVHERVHRAIAAWPHTVDVLFEAGVLLSACGERARGHELLARAAGVASREYADRVGDFAWYDLARLEPLIPLTPPGRFARFTAPVVGP